MNNSVKWYEKIADSKCIWYFVLGFSIFFLAITIVVFKWGHSCYLFNKNYQVDTNLLGTLGDFIGGVLGTIFTLISVFFIIVTFKHQRDVTKDNKKQLENQKFNDLFFEILHLYQQEVKELCGQKERILSISPQEKKLKESLKYNDKDFFDVEKYEIQQRFRNQKSYEKNQQRAVSYYMLFYAANRSKIGAYFRTLYRIYDLIDSSNYIDERQRKEYSKIIRAQLTESELFFIRYNALTLHGKSFVKYINKYNVLKHLPIFELLEFKDWWKDMKEIEKEGVNMLFFDIQKCIRNLFEQSNFCAKLDTSKYSINMCLKNGNDFCIYLEINQLMNNVQAQFSGFEKLESKRIQQLFDCFIKEIFVYNNFEKLNKYDNLDFYSNPIYINDDIIYINSGVKTRDGSSLAINSINC